MSNLENINRIIEGLIESKNLKIIFENNAFIILKSNNYTDSLVLGLTNLDKNKINIVEFKNHIISIKKNSRTENIILKTNFSHFWFAFAFGTNSIQIANVQWFANQNNSNAQNLLSPLRYIAIGNTNHCLQTHQTQKPKTEKKKQRQSSTETQKDTVNLKKPKTFKMSGKGKRGKGGDSTASTEHALPSMGHATTLNEGKVPRRGTARRTLAASDRR